MIIIIIIINGTNELVKIVISLHGVTPLFFHVECKQPTVAKNALCMWCSKPCYYKKQTLF